MLGNMTESGRKLERLDLWALTHVMSSIPIHPHHSWVDFSPASEIVGHTVDVV